MTRVFNLTLTMQGNSINAEGWEVTSKEDQGEFVVEVLQEIRDHLKACMSAGDWGIRVDCYDKIAEVRT